MQLGEAIAAIDSLANGIDPVTGQPLPNPGPYHHPHVIRALFTVLSHLREKGAMPDGPNAEAAMPNVARNLPERVGKPWTPAEDEQLIAEFHAAVEFRDMAKMHGRTRGAIVSRLTKLGEIQPKYRDEAPDMESDFEVPKKNRAHAGKPWTSEQDAELVRHYDAGLPLEEIAERLQRGVNAVEVRLIKLGKLEVESPYVEFDS
jgi:hypothetical protein